MNAHGQVHPHRPSAAVAAAASVERARRASTGGAHLRRGSSFGLTLRAIFAGPNAPGGDEDEEEAAPVTQKQKIDRALKLVMDLVKGPVGTNDRTGLPKKVRELVEGLLRDGELAAADEREVWCKSMSIMSDLHLESQMSKGQVKRVRFFVVSREVSLLKKLHHPNRPVFTYADLATDILMIVQYYARGRATVATLMLAVLAVSLVVQASCGLIWGQGW